jgi:curved DNA-binding protein CbpA
MSLPVYLRLLGISFNAGPREIEKAYRKLAKKARSTRNDAEFLTQKLMKHRKPALLRIFNY